MTGRARHMQGLAVGSAVLDDRVNTNFLPLVANRFQNRDCETFRR
jgi:hypothetical protein